VHHELTIYQLPTSCTGYYLFIKYYFPLHVSSLKCSSSGGYSCIHAVYGTVTTRVKTHTYYMYCCHKAGVDRRNFKFSVL